MCCKINYLLMLIRSILNIALLILIIWWIVIYLPLICTWDCFSWSVLSSGQCIVPFLQIKAIQRCSLIKWCISTWLLTKILPSWWLSDLHITKNCILCCYFHWQIRLLQSLNHLIAVSICTRILKTRVWWTRFFVYFKLEFCRLHRQ